MEKLKNQSYYFFDTLFLTSFRSKRIFLNYHNLLTTRIHIFVTISNSKNQNPAASSSFDNGWEYSTSHEESDEGNTSWKLSLLF